MSNLKDKVILVTGGTSGIGKDAAIELGKAGAKVVVAGRREDEGRAVVTEITSEGGTAEFFKADVAKEAEVEALVAFTVEKFGRLDGAFNNAGVELFAPATDANYDDYRRLFDINVWGVAAAVKHEAKAMLATGGGSIVNTTSAAGHVGMAGASIYVATKHAVEGLTKSFALEFAQHGIRVNAVAPGAIRTEMFDRLLGEFPEVGDFIIKSHPVGRVGETPEITKSVLFLLDPENSFLTGQSIRVDGGFTAQ